MMILEERSHRWLALHDSEKAASVVRYEAINGQLTEIDRRYDARFNSLIRVAEDADRRQAQVFAEKDLRDQQRFDAQQKALTDALLAAEKAVTAALTAANTAVTKAEVANEKRLDGVNEFRDTLRDQAATLMPRAETETMNRALSEKLSDLAGITRDQNDRMREQQQRDIAAIRDDFQKALAVVSTVQNLSAGRDHGIAALWGWIVGAAAVGGFVILALHDLIH